jgi:hypothetical protein|tara:strand:- start:419 stop:667 length:249 start_codon:yes stop_codon:yes gene_type:complete
MLFLPDLTVYVFLKTVFPKIFLTFKIMDAFKGALKVISVLFVNGFGAVDKFDTFFSCEKIIRGIDKSKMESNFFIMYYSLKS